MAAPTEKPPITVRLSSPRGFCAGVERAIRTVEDTLAAHGAPVYVRHEIVHNTHVVERLSAMGAVFVDDLKDAPQDRPVIFSAHGTAKSVLDEARRLNLFAIDAACPLVLKVHAQTRRNALSGRHVYLIGHAGHPEVIGVMGQAPEGAVTLVETVEDVAALPEREGPLAYVTQTTLSVDDTREIINALSARFPRVTGPSKEDICYATSNRQDAVKAAAAGTRPPDPAQTGVDAGHPARTAYDEYQQLVDIAAVMHAQIFLREPPPETLLPREIKLP